MSTTDILSLIDDEISRLEQARALLAATDKKQRGRPRSTTVATVAPKKKRNLSPEGRARLIAAVNARWAKQKEAAK